MKRLVATVGVLLTVFAAPDMSGAATPPLHIYMRGQQVKNLQWLLGGHKPSVYRIQAFRAKVNGVYGKRTVDAVHNMKYRLGYPKTALGGKTAGPTFIAYLKGKRRPFSYRLEAGKRYVALHAYQIKHPPLSDKMKVLVSDAAYLVNHRNLVGYSQAVRMQIVRNRIHLPPLTRFVYEDCSSAVTALYWLSGLPDPNNRGYDGYGFTGTQADHGVIVWHLGDSLGKLKVGDIVFYGGGFPHHHEAVYVGNGRVFSHGSSSGPFTLPVVYRADAVNAHRYVPSG